MAEKIIEKNIVLQSNEDLTTYAIAVCRDRALPSPLDGLKPVNRKILYTMYEHFPSTRKGKTVKSAAVTGAVVQRYHPHSNQGVYASMKPMVNWFESYVPMIKQQGSFGTIWGDGAAADRYTEVALTDYAVNEIIGDMTESYASTDWQENYSGDSKEPIYLPSKVPNLLINGSFGIAVGMRTQIPKHNVSEVIDATICLIDNPDADIILVPDDPQGSDIIESDFAKISHTGKGKYKIRANIDIGEFHGKPALFVRSLPSMVFFESIKDKIEKLCESNMLPQVQDILNNSKTPFNVKNPKEVFEAIIVLKKGTDPNYVKSILYATTELEKTISVNFEVVFNNAPVVWSYKQYLQQFINFRKERKARMYNAKLKECKTKMHELSLYIYALESGKIDAIVDAIRKQKSVDDSELIEFMMKQLPKITHLQAKFLLNTNLKKLSLGYLRDYKEKYAALEQLANEYMDLSIHAEKLGAVIKQELIEAKTKYGCPRRSKIVPKSVVDGIPEGLFKVVITEGGFVKKIDQSERGLSLRNDKALFVMDVSNTDSLLLFGKLAKVYKLPVHKIPFAGKNSNGVDLRTVLNKYVGEGICAMVPEEALSVINNTFKKDGVECDMFTLTKQGLFKRMPIDELVNIPLSGLMYAKLNEGDTIADILIMNPMNEMLIYSRGKVLRMLGTEAPLLNRSTKGNIAMNSKYAMDGMSCITPKSTYIIVITESGRVNKIPLSVIPLSQRAKAGSSVIKLGKTDDIHLIRVVSNEDILHVTTHRGEKDIVVSEIPEGSSISGGKKLIDSSGIISISKQ